MLGARNATATYLRVYGELEDSKGLRHMTNDHFNMHRSEQARRVTWRLGELAATGRI